MAHPLSGHFSFKDANWGDIFSRAEDGDLEAIAIGASILFQGFGHIKPENNLLHVDTALSRDWLKQGAAIEAELNNNEKLCTVMLALMQAASIGMIGEEQKGRDTLVKHRQWILDEAAQGNAAVMRVLSFMHGRGGMGVERSVEKALELSLQGAEKGNPFAMYDVGIAYSGYMEQFADKKSEHLRKIKVDPLEAARYFKRAALMGHSDAQSELGVLITNVLAGNLSITTRIIEITTNNPDLNSEYADLQNPAFGMQMLEAAANQGRISGLYAMGRAYLGIPAYKGAVQRDVQKAVAWFKKAVDLGYPRAFIELAKLYETWFKEMGENHPEHNKATALTIYNHLLGRPRKPGDNITVSTQPLTPDQIAVVKNSRKALEEEAIKDNKTWYRYANGDRRLTFDDGTSVILGPYQDTKNPGKDVPADIQRAQDHETGNGHAKSLNEAYSIYKELLARTADGEYTMPTADEIKKIRSLMAAIERRADSVIEQPNGNRTLIYKGGIGQPDDIVFAGPKEVPDYKKKKAAAKAAKDAATDAGDAPQRPADTSQTTDKDKKRDTGKKHQR